MPTARKPRQSAAPVAGRPHMPGYGISPKAAGLLPWSWAEHILTTTRIFWLTTVTAKGQPHVMPIWGIWTDGIFCFSTGTVSVKARNLAANPRCVLANADPDQALIVHAEGRPVTSRARIKELSKVYKQKYGIGLTADMGVIFELRPTHAFGQPHDDFVKSATRWQF